MSTRIPASNARAVAAHVYAGPPKFKGICTNCGDTRNKHCGRCHACAGYHLGDCVQLHGLGSTFGGL
ncbi:MAG: hypothetical protein BGO38_06885 [Cellulomonas sp. 73-145]|uniref:hypothetical protein n=1 Tax=Cellulomonas sp. 73-145 TaxID=1895739 RepID=UPI000928805B|nr:hypothetical protein [Cellulomonas sp. 73-145]OJV57941.1 MAG: hypothetical protein BGO38_06885 [Cellulomonas sp. 73-145]